MKLTMEEAERRVNVQFDSLVLRHMDREEMTRLSCAGTAVDGGELDRRLLEDFEDVVRLMPTVGIGAIGGVLLRMFWLGYEFGKDAR